MTETSYTGPIDYLVFAFPPGAQIEEGLRRLLEAVDLGRIEVLDLEAVGRDASGRGARLPLAQVLGDSAAALAAFDGVESEILDAEDLDAIADELEPDGFALALLYLEHALDETAAAWVAAGGTPLLEGGVEPDDLEAALAQAAAPAGSAS